MQIKSRQLVESIIEQNQILYTRIFSSFISIPAHILNSNDKVILVALKLLSHLTSMHAHELIDLNYLAISELTGIPLGTINRCMPALIKKIPAANKYLQDHNNTELIELNVLEKFGFASIYNFCYTEPTIKNVINVQVRSERESSRKPIKTEFDQQQRIKLAELLKTGFDKSDLLENLKYTPDRIERNVRYFLEMKETHLSKDQELNYNYFAKCISHDYGKKYMTAIDRVMNYFDEICKVAELIRAELKTPKEIAALESCKPMTPITLDRFRNKSDVKKHYQFKFESLPGHFQRAFLDAVEQRYFDLKYNDFFKSRTSEVIKEYIKFGMMQLYYSVVENKKALAA